MKMEAIRAVLLIEDNAGDARLLREMLIEEGARRIELTHVVSMSEAVQYLSSHAVDLLLLDLGLPDAHGLEAVRQAHAAAPLIPLVVLTGLDDEALASQAFYEGAQDYLIKGQIETRGLLRAMRYATERKRLEWLKDEFVATVSHELRTPLTSISGSLGLLMSDAATKLPERAVRLIEIAHMSCQRLVRLVNDILDVEKLEAGQVAFNFRRVDIRSIVEEAIEANRGFAEGHRVRILLEAATGVGEVRADADRLVQVVTNLLSNAVKFSPADSDVAVTIEKQADVVRISVRDHGPGIPAQFKPRIFERFAQAENSATRQNGGTGLGLSIVRQIVDRLEGKVGFSDAPGGGTNFYVELPGWDRFEASVTDTGAHPDALRILLCEDDLETALALREHLRPFGFAADFAFTAAEAIGRASETQYHAVLVDLLLPDRNGLSVIMRLRQLAQYRDTPIIVVSADPNCGRDDVRSSSLNVSDWLSKPVDFDRLVRVLPRPSSLTLDGGLPIAGRDVVHPVKHIADEHAIHAITSPPIAPPASETDLAVLYIAPATPSVPEAPVKHHGVMDHAVRILHVEDDANIREIVALSLGLDPAMTVISCAGGAEALASVAETRPDLILCDVMMPGMDGPSMLARLREDPATAKIPVIFMTAQCHSKRMEQLMSLGVVAVITKPFNSEKLGPLLRSHLHSARIAAVNSGFRQRLRNDAAALALFREELRSKPDASAAPDGLQTCAHKLAGAAGMFEFLAVSDTASALEQAVIERSAGLGAAGELETKLDALIECIARG